MAEVVYVSKSRIERVNGTMPRAFLPGETKPVMFGVHGVVAEHYGVTHDVSEPHATTLDYIVAAAGACLTDTFNVTQEARKVRMGQAGVVGSARLSP